MNKETGALRAPTIGLTYLTATSPYILNPPALEILERLPNLLHH